MSKKLKPVEKKSVATCIQNVGKAIDAFFAPHTPCTESKLLPIRSEFLTYEDDALDLGWYRWMDALTVNPNGERQMNKHLVTVMA